MTGLARAAGSGVIVLALVWLGLLLGVSFLATPAKFLAPSLTLPVALDVGRQTFGILSPVEIGAALGLLALALASRAKMRIAALAAVAAGLVGLQALWLLPALDARVETILRGGMPENTLLHALYIGIDLVKLGLLLVIAWGGSKARRAAG